MDGSLFMGAAFIFFRKIVFGQVRCSERVFAAKRHIHLAIHETIPGALKIFYGNLHCGRD